MVTSDILARGDAAIHVAHAFTVHAEASETDYFSAVDDLLASADDESLGSGHIGTTELTSGLYYSYVVVDVGQLVMNLEGADRASWQDSERDLAAEVIRRLVHVMATVSPGAKLGSTAPYSRAQLVLAEAGSEQPRTLANAFLSPVDQRRDALEEAYGALAKHLGSMDSMYGQGTERRLAAMSFPDELLESSGLRRTETVPAVASWAASKVQE